MQKVIFGAEPDDREYPDTGCDWHSRCRTCPFAQCKEDVEEDVRSIVRLEAVLNRAIAEVGKTARVRTVEVSGFLGVHQRNVQRYYAKGTFKSG